MVQTSFRVQFRLKLNNFVVIVVFVLNIVVIIFVTLAIVGVDDVVEVIDLKSKL